MYHQIITLMRKNVLFILLMFAAMSYATAQTVVFSDNFDSYTAGSHLAQSNPAWTTWNNLPGSAEDGVISSAQAYSTPNSLFISGDVDQVYPFGNYTTGHYTVAFKMYIPSSGNGAYFNIQHVLLQQWAFNCYFYNNGNGYLELGGSNINFTFPSDEWFPVVMDVDLDQDLASLHINNVEVNSWPFHYTNSGTNGSNQLAGIDLWAGAPNSAVGTYYIDDFVVTEVTAAQIGEFSVTTESITLTMEPNTTATETVAMDNPGNGSTDFRIVTTYSIPNPNTTSTEEVELQHYLDNPVTFVGWPNNETNLDMAVRMPAESIQQHIGKTLNEIHIYMSQAVPTAKLRVYGMNSSILNPGPGDVVYEQNFTPDTGWNSIMLDTPYLIDGSDLWFGISFTQPQGAYMLPLDGNPANDNSCWYKAGSLWYNRFRNTDYDFNICIGGIIDGTPITPWLTVNPGNGSINAGSSVNATVTANSNGMVMNETHTATLHFFSSDLNNDEVVVPVTLNIGEVSINELNQIEVKIYPNPATDFVQVSSNVIERVEIHNMLGQKVFDRSYRDSHAVIPTNGMAPGSYIVTVTTNGTQITKQVIVK